MDCWILPLCPQTMAAAEAMAWGLPGVGFDLEALKSYYPKGMIKSPQGDYKKFAKEIIELLGNKDYYSEVSKEARDLIIKEWDWDKRAEIIFSKIILKTIKFVRYLKVE